jgi:hypothetical protein
MKKCLWCDAENEDSAWECQTCGETEFSSWGGKRENAGSGGPRPGAGRRQTTLKLKLSPEQIEFLKAESERANISVDETVAKLVSERMKGGNNG